MQLIFYLQICALLLFVTISVVKTEPIPQIGVLPQIAIVGGSTSPPKCNGCGCCNGSCAGNCNSCAGKYLFLIMHPTRYLGALSETEEFKYFSKNLLVIGLVKVLYDFFN